MPSRGRDDRRGRKGPESTNLENTNLEEILFTPEEFPEGPYSAPASPDWRAPERIGPLHRPAASQPATPQPATSPQNLPPRER